jgi:cohesin loading factor subunit SCC2
LTTLKNLLSKIIYPFVEASSASSASPIPILEFLMRSTKSPLERERENQKRLLSDVFHTSMNTFPLLTALLAASSLSSGSSVKMSDGIVIQAVYIAIDPFFIEGGDSGSSISAALPTSWNDAHATKGRGKKDKSGDGGVLAKVFGGTSMRGLRLVALSLLRSVCPFAWPHCGH